MDVDTILAAYIACALWSSTDDAGTPLDDDFGPDDIADETREAMRQEIVDFVDLLTGDEVNVDLSGMDAERFGHDFWLTRNGHGAGFWDRGLGELGDTLTKWAHTYGGVDLYVGDDAKVHQQ